MLPMLVLTDVKYSNAFTLNARANEEKFGPGWDVHSGSPFASLNLLAAVNTSSVLLNDYFGHFVRFSELTNEASETKMRHLI